MDLDGIFNAGEAIEFEGKTFTVKELTLEQRGKFGAWLKQRAKADAARSLSEDLPDEWVRLQASVVSQDIAAGLYDWGAPASVHSITRTPDGASYALFLSISDSDPSFDELAARRLFDARLKEVAALLAARALDPPASSGQTGSSPTGPSASPGSRTPGGRKKKSKNSRRVI